MHFRLPQLGLTVALALSLAVAGGCSTTRRFDFVDSDQVTFHAARPGETFVPVLAPGQAEGGPVPGGGALRFRRAGRGVRLAEPGTVGYEVVGPDGALTIRPGTKTPTGPADGDRMRVEVIYHYATGAGPWAGATLEYYVDYLADTAWSNVRVTDVSEPEDALGWTAVVLGGLTFGIALLAGAADSAWGLSALGVTAGGVAWIVWPPAETVRWQPAAADAPSRP